MPASYFRLAAYVRLHARRRPDRVAVLRNGAPVTYAALHRDVEAMTRAVAGFGVAPGAVVAVNHHDLYVHLTVLIALETLGLVAGSFRADEGAECHPLLAGAALVMAHRDMGVPCRRLVLLTREVLEATLRAPIIAPRPLTLAAADAPMMILRSSGTTGPRKHMVVTHAMMATRLRQQRNRGTGLGLNRTTRFLATMHFSVISTYLAASNCLRLGATFMAYRDRGAPAVLAESQPTHLVVLPFQLRVLLDSLPPGSEGPLVPGLTVQTIGAQLTEDLRARTLAALAGRVIESYSANESGPIGAVDATGALRLAPGVTLRVTGPDGALTPPGVVGEVSVRGPGVVRGYLDHRAAGPRDGWFSPGDLAVVTPEGVLRLVGRRADVLNLGGIKLASAALESRLLEALGVRDLAVVQRNDSAGSPPLTVCLVADPPVDTRALADITRPIVGFPFRIRLVAEIPRTGEGKIKRLALQQALFGARSVPQPVVQPEPAPLLVD